LLEANPYGQFSEISDELLGLLGKYPPQSEKQVEDVRKALGDPPDSEGGYYAYSGLRALLAFAKQRSCYLYVSPGQREAFIEFCVNYEPDYLPIMKEGFLLCGIIEYIFDNEISAFDPTGAQQALTHFANYKQDFQSGILEYLGQLQGHYMLSRNQERFIKERIARDEKELLDFLRPENLKKYNLPEVAIKFLLGVLPIPIPVDEIYDFSKKVKEVRDFKKANLDFMLSLTILKQLSNIKEIEPVTKCPICALSPAEIEDMSEEQCHKIIMSRQFCLEHIVGRLDLRKRFGLHGKKLLKEMKRWGDQSVFVSRKKNDSE
jgi:hypothetical protein